MGTIQKNYRSARQAFFYVADTEKEALQGMYPHLNTGFKMLRGSGYLK